MRSLLPVLLPRSAVLPYSPNDQYNRFRHCDSRMPFRLDLSTLVLMNGQVLGYSYQGTHQVSFGPQGAGWDLTWVSV